MRAIAKGAEPPSLTAHRRKRHADYDNYADKSTLRVALVAEQRGICCYCMNRIHSAPDSMKIEHWRSQSGHPAQQLNYRNLLGACLGGYGQPPKHQHCDTHKGDRDLRWNPADPAHHIETRIRYELDGCIRSDEPAFDAQLEKVLNLNLSLLKNSRRGVLDAVLAWWRQEKKTRKGMVPRARFEQERNRRVGGTRHLEPFCQVAVWWLEQRITRMPA